VRYHLLGPRSPGRRGPKPTKGTRQRSSQEWAGLLNVEKPLNPSNKGGYPSAERGEERTWTKENTSPSHTCPAPHGRDVSPGLAGVRKAARKHTPEKFTALLHHRTVDLRRDSVYALPRHAAPGGLA
jgi:hypothetical protein